MTIKQAAMISLVEYNLRVAGVQEQMQDEWEMVRWEVFMNWTISPVLKRRPRKPQDIIRFPWEKDSGAGVVNAEPLTEDEISGLCMIFNMDRKNVTNGQDK